VSVLFQMRTSRTILTLTVVAAVLCADRVATAAAEVRPQVVETARLVGRRLTAGIRHRATATRLDRRVTGAVAMAASVPARKGDLVFVFGQACSLAQLPIPPPVL
jgi:hypothetical protein